MPLQMTDSAPESEMDPTTMKSVVLETDENATIAEVETVTQKMMKTQLQQEI